MPFGGQSPSVVSEIRAVAGAVSQLYDDRQTADYDLSRRWTRSDTLDRVTMVRDAFASWRAIRDLPIADEHLLALFVKER